MYSEPLEFDGISPQEVMDVIEDKDDICNLICVDIFNKLIRRPNKDEATVIEIDIGPQTPQGQPRWQLLWLIRKMLLATLQKMVAAKAISGYRTELRPTRKPKGMTEFVVIECIPNSFLDWYTMEEPELKGLGKFLVYYQELAIKLKGATRALYYLQICAWWFNGKKDSEGFITKSKSDIARATSFTRIQQDSAREYLIKKKWLEIKKGKFGYQALRYRPLKPVPMSRKYADGVVQLARTHTEKVAHLEELETERNAITEAIAENPTAKLQKYENKRTGELPTITGLKKSKFAEKGDDKWQRKGFERYLDENEMRAAYEEYKVLQKRLNELEQKISKTKKSLWK